MLCVMGGNKSPSSKDIENILSSVGIQCESDRVKQVIDMLKGKNLEDLIAQGINFPLFHSCLITDILLFCDRQG